MEKARFVGHTEKANYKPLRPLTEKPEVAAKRRQPSRIASEVISNSGLRLWTLLVTLLLVGHVEDAV